MGAKYKTRRISEEKRTNEMQEGFAQLSELRRSITGKSACSSRCALGLNNERTRASFLFLTSQFRHIVGIKQHVSCLDSGAIKIEERLNQLCEKFSPEKWSKPTAFQAPLRPKG
jgi:hypothetical protein